MILITPSEQNIKDTFDFWARQREWSKPDPFIEPPKRKLRNQTPWGFPDAADIKGDSRL